MEFLQGLELTVPRPSFPSRLQALLPSLPPTMLVGAIFQTKSNELKINALFTLLNLYEDNIQFFKNNSYFVS